jgi:hypothetical protein
MELEYDEPELQLISPAAGPSSMTDGKYYMYESAGLMVLNEQLLRGTISGWELIAEPRNAGTGSMLNPPHPDCVHYDRRAAAVLTTLVSDGISSFPFGIKDPRLTFLFGIWHSALRQIDIDCVPLFSVRPPSAAARALLKRGWLESVDSALELWIRYNTAVLTLHRKFGGSVIIFDESSDYSAQIEVACDKHGLPFDSQTVADFYKPSNEYSKQVLRSSVSTINDAVDSIYEELDALRLS